MARNRDHQDPLPIALLKNTDASITSLPNGTVEMRATLDHLGVLDSSMLSGYENTQFISYRLALGETLPDFAASGKGKRTVWIPASGFMNHTWHDGPLLVIEPDGLVSSYVPTGIPAVLLLAPDKHKKSHRKPPVGKTREQALAIEGAESLRLLRGAVAATIKATENITGALHITLPSTALSDTPLQCLIQLALLRIAGGHERLIAICAPENAMPSPQLRRFCENAGITWSSWDEPEATLEQLFFWYDCTWNPKLLPAINANGPVIPGISR